MVKVEFTETFGLRGQGWTWTILIQDGHPYAICKADHCATFAECVQDFQINGIAWLNKLDEADQTWAKGVTIRRDMDRLIYLASPYSHPDKAVQEQRFNDVVRVSAKLMCEGHLIFSPIAHSHPMAANHELPGDWQFWQRLDEVIISRCDEVWVLMLDGWEASRGIKAEIEIARSQNKEIWYLNAEGEITGGEI